MHCKFVDPSLRLCVGPALVTGHTSSSLLRSRRGVAPASVQAFPSSWWGESPRSKAVGGRSFEWPSMFFKHAEKEAPVVSRGGAYVARTVPLKSHGSKQHLCKTEGLTSPQKKPGFKIFFGYFRCFFHYYCAAPTLRHGITTVSIKPTESWVSCGLYIGSIFDSLISTQPTFTR